jgi:hypothetical protein
VILRLAYRSLATRPVRTLLLACGFGLGIAVMAILLGIGAVILDQARSPALMGGGDVVIAGALGGVENARFVLSSVLGAPDLRARVVAASPSTRAMLYVMTPGKAWPVAARGGVPSLERAIGDPETTGVPGWVDTPADRAWAAPDSAGVLRAMDRFHVQPPVPEFARSWAEWLYFNGRTPDGRVRFYLTFLGGPTAADGTRAMTVRLQLERDGRTTNYSIGVQADAERVRARAPDLDVAGNEVRLDGLHYRIALRLPAEGVPGSSATGHIVLDAAPGRSLPPVVIQGARGWRSGYVVPVLSGAVHGLLAVDGVDVPLDGATGYHDHNWGFWQGVHWQWGQVAHDDVSFVYGRVFPPASVADPDRVPGFLGILGADGPLGVSDDVAITERDVAGSPRQLDITARGTDVDMRLAFAVDRTIRTAWGRGGAEGGAALDFLQLSGAYRVTGHVAGRPIDFTARGAAETFRPR